MDDLLIDRPQGSRKQRNKSQIKYCSLQSWSGINPVKHETTGTSSQIIFGHENETREIRLKSHIDTDKLVQEPRLLNSTKLIDLQGSEFLRDTLHLFIIGLSAFREGIRGKIKKGKRLGSFMIFAHLMGIEANKGHFLRADVARFTGFSRFGIDKALNYWIISGYVVEVRKGQKNSTQPFFLLTALVRSLLFHSWVQGLGGQLGRAPMVAPDILKAIRTEHQMTMPQMAEILGMKNKQEYWKYETGYTILSPEINAKIYEHFYYSLPAFTWPLHIYNAYKAGSLPRYGNEIQLRRFNPKALIRVFHTGYTKTLEVKSKAKRKPRIKKDPTIPEFDE